MKVVTGDIWAYPADVVCITTNGMVKKNGEAVMGRGVAWQATTRYLNLQARLGAMIQKYGNVPIMIESGLMTFPVKHHWRENADLELIRKSAVVLGDLATSQPALTYVLARPGCGNGQLKWEDVRPILEPLLPDNVHVIDKEKP